MKASIFEGDLSPAVGAALRESPTVAVDTETSGLDWRTNELQLCQLFTPAVGPVLLRGVGDEPSVLSSVLADPTVTKIFHHAPFDLRFLEGKWGIEAKSVVCTKTASKLLSPRLPHREHSLQPVLNRMLGVRIEKGDVRTSAWGQEVLSVEQIEYAVADVSHLIDLYRAMATELLDRGLDSLYSEVCAYLPVDAHLEVRGIPNPLTY